MKYGVRLLPTTSAAPRIAHQTRTAHVLVSYQTLPAQCRDRMVEALDQVEVAGLVLFQNTSPMPPA